MTTQTNVNANAGRNFDASLFAKGKKVEMEKELVATYVPDKASTEDGTSFLKGETLIGRFIRTKLVISDKIQGKIQADGRKGRNLHIFSYANGEEFGIWGTGNLDLLMKQIVEGDLVSITYQGRADKPLKPNQAPPMLFDVIKA